MIVSTRVFVIVLCYTTREISGYSKNTAYLALFLCLFLLSAGLSLYHIYVHPKEDGLAQIPLSSATPNNPIDYQFPRSTGRGPHQLCISQKCEPYLKKRESYISMYNICTSQLLGEQWSCSRTYKLENVTEHACGHFQLNLKYIRDKF